MPAAAAPNAAVPLDAAGAAPDAPSRSPSAMLSLPLDVIEQQHPAIVGPPPLAGSVSTYGEKVVAELWLWFASLVVWGTAANNATVASSCDSLCAWQIVVGLFSWLYLSTILAFNLLVEYDVLSRYGWFRHKTEMIMIAALIIWWIPGVAAMSAAKSVISGVAIIFSWAAFFGAILGAWKAYHSYREEDHYTEIPKGIRDLFRDDEAYG